MKKYFFLLLLFIVAGCDDDETVNLTNIAPEVGFYTLVSSINLQIGDSLVVIADAKDEDGEITNVDFIVNSELVFTDNEAPFSKAMYFDQLGDYYLKLRAFDDDSASSESHVIRIHVSEIPEKPNVSLTLDRTAISKGDSIVVKVSASSPNGMIQYTQFYINDNLYGTDSTYPFSFIWRNVDFGIYKIYAKAVDINYIEGISYDSSQKITEYEPPKFELVSTSSADNTFIPGKSFSVYFKVNGLSNYSNSDIKKMELFMDDTLVATIYGQNISSHFFSRIQKSGTFTLTGKLYDKYNKISNSNPLTIKIKEGIWTGGHIVKMISNSSNSNVYALNKYRKTLHIIDSKLKKPVADIILPYLNPVSMELSEKDNKLYIIYSYTNKLTVVNLDNYGTSHYPISSTANSDIEIDEINGKIYIIGSNGLQTYRLNGFKLLNENKSIKGNALAFDVQKMLMYIPESYGSLIYTVSGDSIKKSGIKVPGTYMKGFAFTSDMSKIALRNSNNYKACLSCYRTNDFTNMLGQWPIGNELVYAVYSHDDRYVYCSSYKLNSNSYINKMDANDYSQVQKYEFLNVKESILCTNYDDTVLLAYALDTYSDKNTCILIFYDI